MAITLARQTVASCLCGCGQTVYVVDPKGRHQSGYRRGHDARRPRIRKTDAEVGTARRHDRSRALVAERTCAWTAVGGCRGRVEVAHVNGDDTDNRPSNLKPLCQAHHRLLDNGRIDPAAPVMPRYWVDGSGKRRYVYAEVA